MIPMSLRDIAVLTGGSVHPDAGGTGDVVVHGAVVTDSRQVEPGGLYVARVGEHADGHRFVEAAMAAGAVASLTTHPVDGFPCVVVEDVERAFGRLARGVLDRLRDVTVVAVTGSSGKTSTKDLLAQVLATAGETVAPVDSLNGEVGVPLTVCRVTEATRFLVVEMGARGQGHLRYLTSVAPPNIAIVLNVGSAHLGEFGSRERIGAAKAELVEALSDRGLAVLNADDDVVAAMAGRTAARVVTVGLTDGAQLRASELSLDDSGRASFVVTGCGEPVPVQLQVSGAHQVGNALAVLAAALECGLSPQDAATALSAAAPASRWRMEITERPDGVTVVNDAYNANPESMRAALTALNVIAGSRNPRRRSWAVLGEMLELGADSQVEHAALGRLAVKLGVDRLVAVGHGASPILDAAAEAWTAAGGGAGEAGDAGEAAPVGVADVDAAYDLLSSQLRPGDVVLLKSSRDAGLRWLGDRLVGLEVPS